jgi:Mlc titration factor MtfA (ptsG expression regulator)
MRMLFTWLKNRRRRKLLAQPFPEAWDAILHENVKVDAVLSDTERRKLRQVVQIIVAEKEWEGCRGLDMSEEIAVTIAGQAAILILGFDDFYFDNVQTILVYPDEYVAREERSIAGSVLIEQDSERLGEAHQRGPVILTWNEVRENGRRPGYGNNLVFHEFAHKLDMRNGDMDGTPDLPTRDLRERWGRVMQEEFRRLQRADRHGRRTLLDPYGLENPAEFFAVTTECFFDAPQAMRERYPELYELFRDYYRQDPAQRREFEAPP